MNIEFDPAKDEANIQKHGISLAVQLIFVTRLSWEMTVSRSSISNLRTD
jgi:uncharacterized DUF497 family protein